MKKRFRQQSLLSFLACVIISFTASAQQKPSSPPQLGKSPLQAVVKAMTLEEKARLVVGAGFHMPGMPRRQNNAGGPVVGHTEDKVPGAAGNTVAIPRLGIPAITVSDGPAGVRISPYRNGDSSKSYFATAFPISTLLASTWDTAAADRMGKAFGQEVKEYGIDVLLAPAMNIHRNPLGGRNFEYYSEDPLVSGWIASSLVKGIESNGVGTSIKHFVANNQETDRNTVNTIVSERALREIYLRGFEYTVKKAQPWTVMSSYNLLNGTYTSQEYDLLTTILRKEWGFRGLVMTDWFGGVDPVAQMKAGNDLLMPGTPNQTKAIEEAVKSGQLDEKVLDENVTRVLQLILRSPSFRHYRYSDHPNLKRDAETARQVATDGMVLLRNEGQALPLKAGEKLALFGNTSYDLIAGGTGSGDVNKAYVVSVEQGLTDAGFRPDSKLAADYQAYLADAKAKRPKPRNFFDTPPPIAEMQVSTDEIKRLAAESDAAVFTIGRNAGEGRDRKLENDFDLSAEESSLLHSISDAFHQAGKKLIIVMNTGGVMEVASWRAEADAILLAWQPGQEGGHAIADILSGRVNPSGKLATSFPIKYADVPSANNFPGKEFPEKAVPGMFGRKMIPAEVIYQEGIYVGYRYYNSFKVPVAYPFGYGLSYTQFRYDQLRVSPGKKPDQFIITCTVTNSGTRAGREIVQLYVGAPAKTMDKPNEELRGFAKTGLLAPGKSEFLRFVVNASDLASFDTPSSSWVTEAGSYRVMIGASSEDIRLQGEFTIAKAEVVEKDHAVLQPVVPIDELKNK